jgi:O-antigen/teichoic acid export membrane protein
LIPDARIVLGDAAAVPVEKTVSSAGRGAPPGASGAAARGASPPEFDPLASTEVSHETRLARGAMLQQGAQILRLGGGLIVVTVLARRLSLSALGTYTILLSLITYVTFVKSSVMNAAVVGVSRAVGERRADRLDVVVSTGLAIYLAIGVVCGLALAGIGLAILPALHIPHRLHGTAQLGVVGLAAATMLSWPFQIFDDLLRGLQRFAAVSGLEIFAMIVYVAGALALAFAGAPVSALVTWNASIPLLMGIACLAALRFLGIGVNLRAGLITRAEVRRFGTFSGLLVLGGVADVATYSIDRFALSAIRSPAAVGRYEGPLGAQNMIRYLNGVLTAPVVPIASTFLAAGDTARIKELFLRGLRYSYAATVPLAVTLIVYAAPILRLWLGARFASAGTAASVFCAWWLVGSGSGIAVTTLIAAGRVQRVVSGSWLTAAVNVVLVLSLTGSLGLYGPIIASIAAFTVALAYTLPVAMRICSVDWISSARRAWLPSYSIGVVLACLLLALRWGAHVTSKPGTAAIVLVAPLVYWALYGAFCLSTGERQLVLRTLGLRRA